MSDETIDDGESTTERVCLNGGYHVLMLGGAPHPPECSPPEYNPPEVENDALVESAKKLNDALVDAFWATATVEFEKQTFREGIRNSYRGLFDSSGYNMLLNTQARAGTTTWQTLMFPGPGCMSISVKNGSVTLYDLDVRVTQ